MKRKLAVLLAVSVIVLLAALLLYGREGFAGSCVKNADGYFAEIEWMNGSDRHTICLSDGDVLEVQLQVERGKLLLELQAPDGKPIYTGNGTEATAFTITVPQAGEYTIVLQAKHAKGSVQLQVREH